MNYCQPPRLAVTEGATWAPQLAAPALPPKRPDDIENFKKKRRLAEGGFSEFTKGGFRDVEIWPGDEAVVDEEAVGA